MKTTLYDILRITKEATQEEINTAFQARKTELEGAADPETQNNLKLVRHAFAILSDPQQRSRYDLSNIAQDTNSLNGITRLDDKGSAGLSGFSKLILLALIVLWSYWAYQHFGPPSKKTATDLVAASGQSAITASPESQASKTTREDRNDLADTATKNEPSRTENISTLPPAVEIHDLSSDLAGSWIWNSDKMEFGIAGRGTYYRDSRECFTFSYNLTGDVLTTTADRTHLCGSGLIANYHISISNGSLTMKHIGTPAETHWERPPE